MSAAGTSLALAIESFFDRRLPPGADRIVPRIEMRELIGVATVGLLSGAGVDEFAARIADGVLDAIKPVLNATPEFHGLPWRDLILAVVREHLTAGAIVEPPRDGREA